MNKLIKWAVLSFSLNACANVPELETGEIKTWQLLSTAIKQTNKQKIFIDSQRPFKPKSNRRSNDSYSIR